MPLDPASIQALQQGANNAVANVSGIAGLIYQWNKDRHLTGAQREANAFTAEQAQKAMDFEASQSLQQMKFQERMSNTQWQRGVADMVAAGLNPALAYSQGGAVAPSGASGSGSAGSSVDPGRGMSMSDIIQALTARKQLDLLEAQTAAANASANKSNADANKTNIEASWIDSLNSERVAQIRKDMQLSDAVISEKDYQNALTAARTLQVLKDVSWIDRINEASTNELKQRARREAAEAAISEYEKTLGHRLGQSQWLAIGTTIASWLGLDDKSFKEVIEDAAAHLPGDIVPFIEPSPYASKKDGTHYGRAGQRGF